MVAGLNDVLMVAVGALVTVNVAVAVPPVPLSVEEMVPVVLTLLPLVEGVTLTDRVQDPEAATIPPVKLTLPPAAVAVPPQLLARLSGVATTKPDGRESVKATFVRPVPALGLAMERVKVEVPFTVVLVGLKALVKVGAVAAFTVNEADAVLLPALLSVALTMPLRLFFTPIAVPVTFTDKVQLAEVASVPPVKLTLAEPATAVAVPPQLLVKPLGVETTMPAGRLSVKFTPVRLPVGSTLVTTKLNADVPLMVTAVGVKDFVMVGGASGAAAVTARVADAVPPLPPWVDETAPVTLLLAPVVVPVTLTETEHDAVLASDPPVRLTLPDAATAVTVPPHVFVIAGVADTTNPDGRGSEKAMPLKAVVLFGFVSEKVNVDALFTMIEVGLNAFEIVGGPAVTVSVPLVVAVPGELFAEIDTEFTREPCWVAVTDTEMVQVAFPAI
jgi:hypothetical protein